MEFSKSLAILHSSVPSVSTCTQQFNKYLLPRAREARTRGRVIGVSVGCLFVCLFVDTKTSSLSETGQFMSSTYYVPVRNRKIFASTYLTNESVRQGAKKSRLFKFFRSIETTI